MKNKYVSFISDEHLINCIAELHETYVRAKTKISKRNFYANKIDVFKLVFDSKFNSMSEADVVNAEVLRQTDKSINNSIGTFHENILGGIPGFEKGNLSGYDIKSDDDTLFADIKNKHNTMNSSSAEALFQKLARLADDNKKAKCYWVQILAKGSFCELWSGDINGKEYSHSRVYQISGDQFYALLTGSEDALFQLYKAMPVAINDYLKSLSNNAAATANTVLSEISDSISNSGRSISDQITHENFGYYLGFDNL
jgi:Eco47II restriction endonuclease